MTPQPRKDRQPASRRGARQSRLSRGQRLAVLVTFAVLFAAVVLGGLEGALRLAGFGGYPPTFITAGTLRSGERLIFTDHGGPGSYFFANRSRPGSLDRAALVMPKPAGTVRIMLVGASAAKGNPYPRPLTAGSFLQAMLGDLWPDRNVEVINLGTTAIASFPVLGLMTESLEYEPNLVIVYAGNNEFYGAYGVASLHTAGRSPRMIRLIRSTRSLAIAQFIDAQLRGYDESDPRTMMEAMVGQADIGPDDPARDAAARNLEAFIGAMIRRCQGRSIPVIVCAPPANERDLAPIGDAGAASDPALAAAQELMASDPAAAAAALSGLVAQRPQLATARFLLGRALFAQGRYDEAAEAFGRALDLDPMPWRPPSQSVEAIRRAAASGGAVLCDLEEAFQAASPGGSIGWELMADHVHPSLRGQALIARSIVESMCGLDGPLAPDRDAVGQLPDWTAYADRLGANPYTEYAAAHAMRVLGAIPFFAGTNPGFAERFDAFCRQVETTAPREVIEQLRLWTTPATHADGQRPIEGMVGRALYGLDRLGEAERLFTVAAGSVAPYGSWDLQYHYYALLCRQQLGQLDERDLEQAAEVIERGVFLVESGASRTGAAERYLGELFQLREEWDKSIPPLLLAREMLSGVDRFLADQALVRAFVKTDQVNEAILVIEQGLAGDQR
ncbi:MAG: tetratricopeptide repeat protein, partial [Phycisphaerales bacterium JB039]